MQTSNTYHSMWRWGFFIFIWWWWWWWWHWWRRWWWWWQTNAKWPLPLTTQQWILNSWKGLKANKRKHWIFNKYKYRYRNYWGSIRFSSNTYTQIYAENKRTHQIHIFGKTYLKVRVLSNLSVCFCTLFLFTIF